MVLEKRIIFSILIVFILGWFSGNVYSIYENNKLNIQNPEDLDNAELLEKFNDIEAMFSDDSEVDRNKDSPHDWVKMSDISVYDDRIIIRIDNPEWAVFTDTKSMDPVIDSTANALELIPDSEEDIHVGDIVAYQSKYKSGTVTHRVVEIGNDTSGWYARLKGDNNDRIDPGKVRFSQIKRIVFGIIY